MILLSCSQVIKREREKTLVLCWAQKRFYEWKRSQSIISRPASLSMVLTQQWVPPWKLIPKASNTWLSSLHQGENMQCAVLKTSEKWYCYRVQKGTHHSGQAPFLCNLTPCSHSWGASLFWHHLLLHACSVCAKLRWTPFAFQWGEATNKKWKTQTFAHLGYFGFIEFAWSQTRPTRRWA